MSRTDPYHVCFVCTGNICRSPTAEIVLVALAHQRGLGDDLLVDSAGTGEWHIGERADHRALAALVGGGYDGQAHRARRFEQVWFTGTDLVIALDRGHARTLRSWAATPQDRAKVRMLRSFDAALAGKDEAGGGLDVADPYYSGESAFTVMLEQVERACEGLLDHVEHELGR